MSSSKMTGEPGRRETAGASPKPAAIPRAGAPAPSALLRRALLAPRSLAAGDVLGLQRALGNRAVGRLLSAVPPSAPTLQRAVPGAVMNLWDRENNQTVALDSGSKDQNEKEIKLKDDVEVDVGISEFALNHFVNRHTYREFSFKDPNIKAVNSFWKEGTTREMVLETAGKVVEGLETEILNAVDENRGAVTAKTKAVAGETVGYNISLDADSDSFDEDEERFTKWNAAMQMFYPDGPAQYDYYEPEELREIRTRLQGAPYNKVLQLKRLPGRPAPGRRRG